MSRITARTFPLWRIVVGEENSHLKQTARAHVMNGCEQTAQACQKISPKWLIQMTTHPRLWKIPAILVTPEPSISKVQGSIARRKATLTHTLTFRHKNGDDIEEDNCDTNITHPTANSRLVQLPRKAKVCDFHCKITEYQDISGSKIPVYNLKAQKIIQKNLK